MNNLTRWKLVGYMTALFVAGAAAGALATRPSPPKPKLDLTESIRRHLQHKLNLTPEQQQKIEPLVEAAGDKIKTLQDTSLKEITQVSDALDAQIAPMLNPDQANILAKMVKDRHDAMCRHLNKPSADFKPGAQ
jgi:Spy/CpxP family protein refolding chaperone